MEQGLGLEERTARLLRRSEAVLSRSTCPTPPEGAEPRICPSPPAPPGPATPGDPLLQWRLRRGAGPGLEMPTPLWDGASLGSTNRRTAAPRPASLPLGGWGSQDALCRGEAEEGGDSPRSQPSWRTPDSHDAPRREEPGSHDDLQQPPSDSYQPLRARGRGSQHAPRGAAQVLWGGAVGPDMAGRDPLEQELEAPGDPVLRLLWGRSRVLRGRLRAVESLLAVLPRPSPTAGGAIK